MGLYDGETANFAATNEMLIEQYKIIPLYNTLIDRKLMHSQSGFAQEDAEFYGANKSFTSQEQVFIVNPCDLSGSSASYSEALNNSFTESEK